MNMPAFAWLAAIIMASGPWPASDRSLEVRMCSGATFSIPLGDRGDPAPDPSPKACHAAECRQRVSVVGKPRI